MLGAGNAVLLERPINSVAGKLGLQAEWFVGLLAECARQTRIIEPLDAHSLADLAIVIRDLVTSCHHDTSSLVATNKW